MVALPFTIGAKNLLAGQKTQLQVQLQTQEPAMQLTTWQRLLFAGAAAVIGLLTAYGLDTGDIDGSEWLLPVVAATGFLFLAVSPQLFIGDRPRGSMPQSRVSPTPSMPGAIERLTIAYTKLRRALIAQFDRPELLPLPPLETDGTTDEGAAAIGEMIYMNTTLAWMAARVSKLMDVEDPPERPTRHMLVALGRSPNANQQLNNIITCLQEHTRLEQEAIVAECAYVLLARPMTPDGKGMLRAELRVAGQQFQSYVEGVICDILGKQNEQLRQILATAGNAEQPADPASTARARVADLDAEVQLTHNDKALAAAIVRMANLVPTDAEPLRGRLMRAYFDFVSDQSGFARPVT